VSLVVGSNLGHAGARPIAAERQTFLGSPGVQRV
jgi:hypothetical protein